MERFVHHLPSLEREGTQDDRSTRPWQAMLTSLFVGTLALHLGEGRRVLHAVSAAVRDLAHVRECGGIKAMRRGGSRPGRSDNIVGGYARMDTLALAGFVSRI